MSVERVKRLLLEMSVDERENLWREMRRHGVDVVVEGQSLRPDGAFERAFEVGGSDRLREIASERPDRALTYAIHVDKGPHAVTRAGAIRHASTAVQYAVEVDGGPREDTRRAACRDQQHAYRYAILVDKGPHEDTRNAVSRPGAPAFAALYAVHVDKCYHPVTWASARGSRSELVYASGVEIPKGVG